ncbi:hypothetical protein IV203_002857 [Nitzschia inconspicua]|uniref:Reverse transcriptase Ty1/copia-type domain-containing protein n=1 Tax=Nitzschia inconspicua TaxID=303405 RepID=A0A9K3PN48_9STRA|nr:hypothetical protein IV203_002857 [Nitzschia inconspicua]
MTSEEAEDGGSGNTVSAPSANSTKRNDDHRGHERDRGSDDSFSSRRNNNGNGITNGSTNPVTFQGNCKDLAGHLYILDGEEDLFIKTTRAIGEYIAARFKDAGEFRLAMDPENLGFEELEEPKDPDDSAYGVVLKCWEIALKSYQDAKQTRISNQKKAFSLILGQCSQAVRSRLRSCKSWTKLSQKSDVIGLLKILQSSLHDAPGRYESDIINDALDRFSMFGQNGLSVNEYHSQLKGLVDALEYSEGTIGLSDKRIMKFNNGKRQDVVSKEEWADAAARARNDLLAVRFIKRSDPSRYGALIADLQNQYACGNNQYPATLDDAYTMLTNYVNPQQRPRGDRPKKKKHQGLSFLQEGDRNTDRGGGRGGRGGRGGQGRGRDSDNNNEETAEEYVSRPTSTGNATTRDRLAQLFAQRYGKIPRSWMLADSCSSVDIFCDATLLHDIHEADEPLTLHCNAGSVTLTLQGYLPGYPEPIWYYPDGIANIFSLRNLSKHYHITMDSAVYNGLRLRKPDGTTFDFVPSDTGLYHLDSKMFGTSPRMWSLITAVKEQAAGYTKRQLDEAQQARRMQNIIMHPSDKQLSDVAIHHLRGCPVTKRLIQIASNVFGPNLGSLKGKTVHRPSSHIQPNMDPVPPDILERHQDVILATHIMFVNKIPNLLTVSRDLRFVTVTDIPNRQLTTVEKELQKIVHLYERRGFRITSMLCDPEFEELRSVFPFLNPCSADEHVPEAEIAYAASTSPCLSAIFHALCVLTVHSPHYLLVGNELTYNKHVRLEFGSYVQTHEAHTNEMRQRTLGAICLGPTGNSQGGHYFMSLTSGERIIRHKWTSLPMPAEAIARVSHIGRRQGMPSSLTFSNRHDAEILDAIADTIEDDHHDVSDDDSDYSYDSDEDTSFVPGDDVSIVSDPAMSAAPAFPAATGVTQLDQALLDQTLGYATALNNDHMETREHESREEADDETYEEEIAKEESYDIDDQESAGVDESTGVEEAECPENTGVEATNAGTLTQMTANKGVKLFGAAGEQAIEKELRQLLTRDVMHGVDSQTLTREQRRAALRYLMFLKEKRCGTIKGRGCADGRKQRLYKTKEETSSPALSIEALFLSCVIDAYERRYVLTCNIPGAFMQAEMDELLHLKLDGTILEILLRMEPSYCQYVAYENGKKVLYAQLDKALYGAVQSALLFWKKLTAFVVDVLGFEINPYDECVANKIINGKQEAVYDSMVHNYLGMRIDYSIDGKVQFTMPTMVNEIIAQLPMSLSSGPSATPAGNHLFVVDKNAQKLSETNSDLLHWMTTQLLYLCKRARPDLQTAVAFLITRVVAPDCDDIKKLGRCVRYLRRTAHLPLVLEANCVSNIRWWVDASYAVHPDMRSHTGGTMTFWQRVSILHVDTAKN